MSQQHCRCCGSERVRHILTDSEEVWCSDCGAVSSDIAHQATNLVELVRQMRELQIKYFKYRKSEDLHNAKQLEVEVDKLLKKDDENQKTMFFRR